VLAACVTVGMCTLSVFPVGTSQASAASSENHALNPVPQELNISGKGFPLTPDVGIVVDEKTDEQAIHEVEAALEAADVKRIVRIGAG
jgi:hyaluronoglucosaminidase